MLSEEGREEFGAEDFEVGAVERVDSEEGSAGGAEGFAVGGGGGGEEREDVEEEVVGEEREDRREGLHWNLSETEGPVSELF